MILFAVAGLAVAQFAHLDWAVPVGVLVGLLVAPLVPLSK